MIITNPRPKHSQSVGGSDVGCFFILTYTDIINPPDFGYYLLVWQHCLCVAVDYHESIRNITEPSPKSLGTFHRVVCSDDAAAIGCGDDIRRLQPVRRFVVFAAGRIDSYAVSRTVKRERFLYDIIIF